jgi:two-component system, sensor histidine kinase RpfC
LVANAIKFTDHGSVDLFVSTNVATEHLTQIEFKIKDTGIGMSASALSHIFDAFKQADSSISRKYGGTGLGTSIAKQLVNMMGGDITVASALGVGSLFTVTLTLKQAQPQTEDNETQALTPVSETQDNIVRLSTHHKFSKKTRVLIADDNVINRMILIEVLQKNGCVVKAVNDGAEALDALEMHQFDMMILDYNMPEHTGLEVFKIYHALAGAKPVRSVILTADATAKTRDECLDAGVYSVFTKPIITKQINQLVKSYQQERDNDETVITSDLEQTNPKVRLVDTGANPYVEPLIDQQRMAHLIKLGNGESFLIKLITEFIEATDSAVTALSEECAELNFEKIHELAHSLAGESANVGLMPLSKHCRTLMNLTILDTQSIREKLSNVERTYIQTRAQLQAMLKTLSAKRSNN